MSQSLSHSDVMQCLSSIGTHIRPFYISLYECFAKRSDVKEEPHDEGLVRTTYLELENNEHGCLVEYVSNQVLDGDHGTVNYPSPILMQIGASFETRFRSSANNLDKQKLEAFIRSTGIFQTWPYWREYLSSTQARLHCPLTESLSPLPIAVAVHLAGYKDEDEVSEVNPEKPERGTTSPPAPSPPPTSGSPPTGSSSRPS